MRKIYPAQIIFLIISVSVAGFIFVDNISAQPGTETDPVVSLSYLEQTLRLDAVVLEGGEEFPVLPGRGVILLDGSCVLSGPDTGQVWFVDVTDGDVYDGAVMMVEGHYYYPLTVAGESVTFTIEAMQTSVVAVPGGSGTE